MIADTDFIIDLAHGDSGASAMAEELKKAKIPLAITAVTVFEMWQGSGMLSESERSILVGLITKSMVIPLEHENARTAGIVQSGLRRKSSLLSPPDALIAGITLDGNDTLLTRNKKDFSRVSGLQLKTY